MRQPPMTREEWVEQALQAREEQGLPEDLDDETAAFIADIFLSARRQS